MWEGETEEGRQGGMGMREESERERQRMGGREGRG